MASSSTTRLRNASLALALALSGVAFVAASACTTDAATMSASRRGEACRVSADCADGLSCAPVQGGSGGGTCVTGRFRVAPTAKECALVECSSGADCCARTTPAACDKLRADCVNDAGLDPPAACASFALQCGCDTGRVACRSGACVSVCQADRDCTSLGAGKRCAGGACVACAVNEDCAPGLQCTTGACTPPCRGDGDCAGFDRCLDGRCVASGCQTDRECVAATRVVDARCGTDGACIVPCETDLECGSPTAYAFVSCIDKRCTYVGCASDKDCRLFFTGASDASALPPTSHPVCRDPGLGDVVKPAP
jgi:hypothetical protein